MRFIEWVKTNPVPINSKINYLTNAREIAVVAVKEGKATATRIGNDSTPDSLSVSISTPVKDNDKSAGDIPYNTELVTYAIGALYNLATYIRPEWVDNEETNLTIDVFIDGTKCQSRNGVVAMNSESYTFDI